MATIFIGDAKRHVDRHSAAAASDLLGSYPADLCVCLRTCLNKPRQDSSRARCNCFAETHLSLPKFPFHCSGLLQEAGRHIPDCLFC